MVTIIQCTNFVSTTKLAYLYPEIGYNAKKWGEKEGRKERHSKKVRYKNACWSCQDRWYSQKNTLLEIICRFSRKLNSHKIFFFLWKLIWKHCFVLFIFFFYLVSAWLLSFLQWLVLPAWDLLYHCSTVKYFSALPFKLFRFLLVVG